MQRTKTYSVIAGLTRNPLVQAYRRGSRVKPGMTQLESRARRPRHAAYRDEIHYSEKDGIFLLEFRGVSKYYGKFAAVADASFTAEAGLVYGLVGYNGAGKTTLLKTAAGVFKPERGAVLASGVDVFDNAAYHREMFLLPDEPYFPPQASLDTLRRVYRGYYPGWSDKTYKKLRELFRLDGKAKISGFSKGMQRQAAILIALATHPKYLIMDEAFDGLDLSKRTLMKSLLREYAQAKGAVLLVSSHNLSELEKLADRVGVLRDRVLTLDAPVSELPVSLEELFSEESGSDYDFNEIF